MRQAAGCLALGGLLLGVVPADVDGEGAPDGATAGRRMDEVPEIEVTETVETVKWGHSYGYSIQSVGDALARAAEIMGLQDQYRTRATNLPQLDDQSPL